MTTRPFDPDVAEPGVSVDGPASAPTSAPTPTSRTTVGPAPPPAPIPIPAAAPGHATSSRRSTTVTVVLGLPALAVVALALVGPWLAPFDPDQPLGVPYAQPGSGLLFGGDRLGRDVWSRVLCGGRSVVVVATLATAVTTAAGVACGVVAARAGGWVDALLGRAVDLAFAVPPVVVLLVLLHGWGYGAGVVLVAAAVTGVPLVARIARATTRGLLHVGYVEQAPALGESTATVMVREILPAVAPPILADAGTRLIGTIYLVAAAGFLGFGPGSASWGAMVSENLEGASLSPWGTAAPMVLLAVLAVSANLALDRMSRAAGS